jgi:uncharacterized protein YkwD
MVGGLVVMLPLGLGCTATWAEPRPPAVIQTPPAVATAAREPEKAEPTLLARELLKAHNEQRAKEDLPPLTLNGRLSEAAQGHAQAMADAEKMAHEGPADDSTPAERIARAGYRYKSVAENVAAGQDTVEMVVDDWMDSEGHRKNILGPNTQMGVGRAVGKDDRTYWCVNFGTPWPDLDAKGEAQKVLDELNRRRAEAKLGPIELEAILTEVAGEQAKELAKSNELDGDSMKSIFPTIQDRGHEYRKAAVSLGIGLAGAKELIDDLMGRPDQEESLMGPFDKLGVGIAKRPDGAPVWLMILTDSGRG